MEPEYCLLWVHRWLPVANDWWCLSAGVWAAWAQGVMSAGAVLYSVLVSRRQHELDGQRQRNANRIAAIERVSGVVDLVELQIAAFERAGAWINGSAGFDPDLNKELHHRGNVLNDYTLHNFEPLDARWLVAQVQASMSTALSAFRRLCDQRNSPGVKKEYEGPVVAWLHEGLNSARVDLVPLKDWCRRKRLELE